MLQTGIRSPQIQNSPEWFLKIYPIRNFPFCIIFLTGNKISNGLYTKILDETAEIVNTDITDIVVWENAQIGNLADVAELADAQASGACGLRLVEVRLLSSAVNPP